VTPHTANYRAGLRLGLTSILFCISVASVAVVPPACVSTPIAVRCRCVAGDDGTALTLNLRATFLVAGSLQVAVGPLVWDGVMAANGKMTGEGLRGRCVGGSLRLQLKSTAAPPQAPGLNVEIRQGGWTQRASMDGVWRERRDGRHRFSFAARLPRTAPLHRGAVMLTFDDSAVAAWHACRALFLENGVRCTFFVARPQKCSAAEMSMLRELQADGHEIACHSWNHLDPATFAGPTEYFQQELSPALARLREEGLVINSFAFPYGRACPGAETLRGYFKTIRLTGISPELARRSPRPTLSGWGIDSAYGLDESRLDALFARAARGRRCLTLYAHDISTAGGHAVTPDRLERIIVMAKRRGLDFLTASELSSY